eukprot:Awhi_evm2s5129
MTLDSFESLNLLNSKEGLTYLSKTLSINDKDLEAIDYTYPLTPLVSQMNRSTCNDRFELDVNDLTLSLQYDPVFEFSIYEMHIDEKKKNTILLPKPRQAATATYLPLRRTRPKKKAKTRANYIIDKKKEFRCTDCGRYYSTHGSLRNHFR